MKNRYKILIALMSFMIVFGCKKEEENLRIEGVVTDPQELINPAVAGAQIKLLHNELSGGTFNTSFSELASATTNGSGAYLFEFERQNSIEFKLTGEKENYFGFELTINPDNVQPGNTYTRNVNMYPKAAISTTIRNDLPENASDVIDFRFLNASFDCACCTGDNVILNGESVDSTSICQLYGNSWLNYYYTVDKSSGFYTVVDSVYCNSFDTTYIEISY